MRVVEGGGNRDDCVRDVLAREVRSEFLHLREKHCGEFLRRVGAVAQANLGVAVSSGSACTVGTPEPSHVLLAMGLEPRLAASAVRFSLGWGNTAAEIDRLLQLLPPLVERLRRISI